jgi:hypothetical protein
MSNKNDHVETIHMNTILAKAALRVAAKKLVTGTTPNKGAEAVRPAGVTSGAGKIITSDAPLIDNSYLASQLDGAEPKEKSRDNALLRLAIRAVERAKKRAKTEADVATLFKNAYMKSKE